ncbi:unnamed protein product [Adineta ricciae]|uniref:Uronyl 2-sulfotransferase-like protein n=1 Tax=Adineta ricciae TaxID=249248 RepID=A0A816CQ70_ADIRI|nr:unnamed protein product [Adineta ricciae]
MISNLIVFLSIVHIVHGNATNSSQQTTPDFHVCSLQSFRKFCENDTTIKIDKSLTMIKGYPLHVVYNRVPKSASEMLRKLFREQAESRHFTIENEQIFVPFRLSPEVHREIASDILNAKAPVLYERHMYFVDFNALKYPQPVYINIIRDPVKRIISQYYWTRQSCREENRCYLDMKYFNETLDECVQRRSASECINPAQGVDTILPFFCGHDPKCESLSNYSLNEAKKNIINHYTVVGVVEELYNFLFLLERLFPRFFRNISLRYMSDDQIRIESSTRTTGKRPEPSNSTKAALRKALALEYDLYDFVKTRFQNQFQQVLLTMTNV